MIWNVFELRGEANPAAIEYASFSTPEDVRLLQVKLSEILVELFHEVLDEATAYGLDLGVG